MDVTTLIGILGAIFILIGFVLNELHRIDRDSLSYDVINFVGGALLALYAWLIDSAPFLVLNVIWTMVALRDVLGDLRSRKP